MPHGYGVTLDDPNIYNKDCSRGKISREEAIKSTGGNVFAKLSGELIGYESNYLCFMTRVRQFVKFINDFDPEGIVIITADHGVNIADLSNKVFLLAK